MNQRVGHRFHPTDEELINYFLKNKVLGHNYKVEEDISEVDICKWEPWELPNRAVNNPGDDDPEWFFFCLRDYKYSNSRRANRTTKVGYWKATGKDRKIWSKKGPKKQIGIKKTLVFYKRSVPNGIRTNWVIHEYHPTDPDFPNERAYVICRLKKNSDEKADDSIPDEGESSSRACFAYGNISENTAPEVDPPSQADPGAITDCDELDSDLFAELIAQLYGQDHDLPSDWNGIQTLDITEPPLSNNFSSVCNGVQTQFGTTEPPLPNSLSSDCNGVQTEFGTAEQEEDFALADSYLIDECEAYPEETISHTKLVVESGGLNLNSGVIDMSSPQLLESLREMPYIEDCHEVAITQSREAVEHVIATDMTTTNNSDANMSMKSSWHGQVGVSLFSHNAPQLSHNSPQLSHNSSLLTVLQQRILMQNEHEVELEWASWE